MRPFDKYRENPTYQRGTMWVRVLSVSIVILIVGWLVLNPPMSIRAQGPLLTINPITWNVIGLDATDVNDGPNVFPVGVRLCNNSGFVANNVVTLFVQDSVNPYINLTGFSNFSLLSLANGGCVDYYFYIRVTRDTDAFDTFMRYRILATADGFDTASTPSSREIYVERLNPWNNLLVQSISGPSIVTIGQSYRYVMQATTTDEAYQQLEHFIHFPNTIFRVTSVQSTYTSPPGSTNDKVYADACGWQNDPTQGTYRSCIGPEGYPGGSISGTLVTTYTVQVVGAGAVTLSPVVYGSSSGSYRYNSNFGTITLPVVAQGIPTETPTSTITNTPSPTSTETPTATVTPTPTITGTPFTATPTPTRTNTGTPPTPTYTGTIIANPGVTKTVVPSQANIGGTVTFTIRVVNSGSDAATNVRVDDSLTQYTYINIFDLTTTKGTINISGRTATVNIGVVNPGENVTITLVVRVNSTAIGQTQVCNTAVLHYGTSGSRSSNQRCFTAIGGSTLPGTGELPINLNIQNQPSLVYVTIFLTIATFGLLGLLAVIIRKYISLPMKQSLLRLTASAVIFLIIVILAVGCTGERVENTTGGDGLSIELNNSQTQIAITPSPTTNPLAELPAYLFATPKPFKTLPSYPIPSPTFIATPEPGETGPDTSAVIRIVIPALGVDAEVAYVPFDGQSWLIQGLREEVAWMGNTSWPGLGGNTALAGHVTVAGLGDGPFRYLIDLKQGDEIILYTERNAYTYRVRERVVVAETDMWVTEPSETAQITLITCVDWNERIEMYLKRLVVFADQISVQAMAQY